MNWSPSKFADWEKCPYLCYLKHVSKEVPFPKTPWITLGSNVHKAIEVFHKTDPEPGSYADLEAILTKCWVSEGFDTPEEEKKNLGHARRMLKWFFANRPRPVEKRYVEEPFSVSNDLFTINGIFDRVDVHQGGVEVVDYKTGKTVPNSLAELRQSYQPVISLWAAKAKYGCETPKMTVINLRHGISFPVPFNMENQAFVFRKICMIVDLQKAGKYETRVGDQCKRCEGFAKCLTGQAHLRAQNDFGGMARPVQCEFSL